MRQVKKIVLLTKVIIDVIRVHARLSTEQHKNRLWPNRFSYLLAALSQFSQPLRVVEHRRWRCDADYSWFRAAIGQRVGRKLHRHCDNRQRGDN
jgi:hypothetical protein